MSHCEAGNEVLDHRLMIHLPRNFMQYLEAQFSVEEVLGQRVVAIEYAHAQDFMNLLKKIVFICPTLREQCCTKSNNWQ